MARGSLLGTGLISLLLLHSCARVPEHSLATTASTADCDTSVQQALTSGEFAEGEWPSPSWWESYGDPNLNQLIEMALANSPTLKNAEERLKMAVEAANAQRAYLYPEIDLNGDSNWQHFSKNGLFRGTSPIFPAALNQLDLSLNFSYEFDFWGKNRSLYEAALGEASSQQAELAQSTLILTTSLAYSYFQRQLAVKKLELLLQVAHNHEQLVAIAKARFEFALDNSIQENTVEQAYLEAKKLIVQTEEDITLFEEQIKAMSAAGQDATIAFSPHEMISEDRFVLPSTLTLDLLVRRPDLQAKLWLAERASHEIHAAKADFYPNINLMAFVGLETIKDHLFFRRSSYMGSLNPAFTLPIFTAGRLRAQLQNKVAEFNAAVQSYNELVLQAAEDVATQLTKMLKLHQQIELQRQIVVTVTNNSQLVEQRFERALDPLQDYLRRFNEQLQQEITLADLSYSRRLAAVLLVRALGGGYSYD